MTSKIHSEIYWPLKKEMEELPDNERVHWKRRIFLKSKIINSLQDSLNSLPSAAIVKISFGEWFFGDLHILMTLRFIIFFDN